MASTEQYISSGDVVVAEAMNTNDNSTEDARRFVKPTHRDNADETGSKIRLHQLPHELLWMVVDHLRDSEDIVNLEKAMRIPHESFFESMNLRMWFFEQRMDRDQERLLERERERMDKIFEQHRQLYDQISETQQWVEQQLRPDSEIRVALNYLVSRGTR